MEKKKLFVILAIILGSVVLIGGGVTFAYYVFGLTGNGNDEENKVVIESTSLGTINYDLLTPFPADDLYPGGIGIQKFVISKGSQDGKGIYEINLSSTLDESFGNDILISLYKSTDASNVSVTKGTLTTSGSISREDTLNISGNPELVYEETPLITSDKIKLEVADFDSDTLEDTTYYLVYKYLDNGEQNDQMGKSFTTKITVSLLMEKDTHNLKIKYVNANNITEEVSSTYETALLDGSNYSIPSPSIDYYQADIEVVSGKMRDNKEVIVKYSPIHDENGNGIADEEESHVLTINYLYDDGSQAAESHTETLEYNDAYNITSPTITNYLTANPVVSGNMGYSNRIVNVVFSEDRNKNGVLDTTEKAANVIEGMMTYNTSMLINDDPDNNVRYYGSNPNNYVSFNNETWRIIGVFDIKTSTSDVTGQKRIKLIREESDYTEELVNDDPVFYQSWDSHRGVNYWGAINQWGESVYEDGTEYAGATLMQILNGDYLNGTGIYTNYGLNRGGSALIENAVWNTGSLVHKATQSEEIASAFYLEERGTATGRSSCGNNSMCTDTVVRTTTWTGKVAIFYASDYAYATGGGATKSRSQCLEINISRLYLGYADDCVNGNWLEGNVGQWTLSTSSSTYSAANVYYIDEKTTTNYMKSDASGGGDSKGIRPCVYLNSNVTIKSGNGTQEKPYVFELQS